VHEEVIEGTLLFNSEAALSSRVPITQFIACFTRAKQRLNVGLHVIGEADGNM
jgi:hypothetical protein